MTKIFVVGAHSPKNRMMALLFQKPVPTDDHSLLGEIKSPEGQLAWKNALGIRQGQTVETLINGKGYYFDRDDLLQMCQEILPQINYEPVSAERANDIGVTKKLITAYSREHNLMAYVCDENPENQYEIPGLGDPYGSAQDAGVASEAELRAAYGGSP